MTSALDDLSHDERLELARDLRAAEAKQREADRLSAARARERHQLNMRIDNLNRRRGRLVDELKQRDDACAPFEATLAESEPDADDRFAHERWTLATANARENLAEHERRRGYLRKIITEIDDELTELSSKLIDVEAD